MMDFNNFLFEFYKKNHSNSTFLCIQICLLKSFLRGVYWNLRRCWEERNCTDSLLRCIQTEDSRCLQRDRVYFWIVLLLLFYIHTRRFFYIIYVFDQWHLTLNDLKRFYLIIRNIDRIIFSSQFFLWNVDQQKNYQIHFWRHFKAQ